MTVGGMAARKIAVVLILTLVCSIVFGSSLVYAGSVADVYSQLAGDYAGYVGQLNALAPGELQGFVGDLDTALQGRQFTSEQQFKSALLSAAERLLTQSRYTDLLTALIGMFEGDLQGIMSGNIPAALQPVYDTLKAKYLPGSGNPGAPAGGGAAAPAQAIQAVVAVAESSKAVSITRELIQAAEQSGTPVTVNIPADVDGATVSLASLLATPRAGAAAIATGPLPALVINAAVRFSQGAGTATVVVSLPRGTVVSAPADSNWNGVIQAPAAVPGSALAAVSGLPDGLDPDSAAVVAVGYGDVALAFDRPVQITLPGQHGKSVGYIRDGVFRQIVGPPLNTNSAGALPSGSQDGYYDDGVNIVIWTRHFTQFVVYAVKPPGAKEAALSAYTDVPDSYWAAGAIRQLAQQGIISGYADGSFRPDSRITRAEFASVIARALNLAAVTPPVPRFRDVSPSDWEDGAVEAAAAAGLITGDGAGAFKPDDPITRQEMAGMLLAAVPDKDAAISADAGAAAEFTDEDAIAGWAGAAVAVVAGEGLISGYPDGSFGPLNQATRAEASAVVSKLLALRNGAEKQAASGRQAN